MATFRALESSAPEKERLFHDPFATAFLSKSWQIIIACCSIRLIRKMVAASIQIRWPGTFTAAAARTKLIDDMICHAIKNEGINQVIILNATYDTRPHRLSPGLPVHYVELDHPDIQRRKRSIINALGGLPAVHVDYIPLDMNTESISEVVPQLFHREHYKSLFLWEGVTSSQEARQAEMIFHYIKQLRSGTQIIFTYADRAVLENPKAFYGFPRIDRLLKRAGENWDFGMCPTELRAYLDSYNMVLHYEGGAADYRAQYFGEKSKGMKGYEYFRLARAEVK